VVETTLFKYAVPLKLASETPAMVSRAPRLNWCAAPVVKVAIPPGDLQP